MQKIQNFIGVPDSTMKHFIDQGLKKNKILITTKEEEAPEPEKTDDSSNKS